jgi:hypothetical protein
MYGPTREKLTGICRKICKEELHNLYFFKIVPIRMIKPRVMRRERETCNIHWGGEECINILAGKPEGKGSLGVSG